MKIEKLDSDRLQITLTYTDIAEHNIDFQQLCESKDDLNRFITYVLMKAKKDTDFDLLNGQFLIRVLQNDAEIVLTIIRLNTSADSGKTPLDKNTKYKLVEKQPEKPMVHTLLIDFPSSENFSAFILGMKHFIAPDSTLYRDNERYFLFITPNPSDYSHVFVTATEFGRTYKDDKLIKIVLEGHDKKIATGQQIISLAELISY